MPINSRRKGFAEERALVRFLQAHGFAAEKCSRIGYTGPDLSVPLLGIDRRVEVKIRANGFQRLYDWLTGADMLIIRCDRREPLVVLPLRLAETAQRPHLRPRNQRPLRRTCLVQCAAVSGREIRRIDL
jgi:hypothetical protein